MKKWIQFLCIMGCCLFVSPHVLASTEQANTDKQQFNAYESLIEDSELQSYWDQLGDEYQHVFPEMDKADIWSMIRNEDGLSLESWFQGVLRYLFYELIENGKLLATLILLTLFCLLLQTIQNAFEKQMVSKIAYAVVYMMLIIISLKSFHLAATYVTDTVDLAKNFLIALLPLMLGLLASLGNLLTISFFHPIIIFLIHTSVLIISNVVIPMFLISAILQIVSTISQEYKATKLANLIKNIAIGILGVMLTVFLGVISVQGAASAIQDGIAMRTAKFVTGNFIPVIGRIFTDATDTVLSATMIIKNGIGLVGVVILIAIVLFPALKIFVLALIYKIATAVLQPIGDGPVIECMEIVGKHILYLFAALLMVTFMFFFTIVILIISSNLTMMVR
ncbi:stage III sporulation protein AE [Gracilibacillus halophilus YIM-C55.5]|uniref:Stage III sporulation protein AE n=1 Tax=Gracilibacillus halophilus YIM-C55.5 TaxID=1308866 RepID=N4WAX1_9BACI|nr:stage III sporulation protein AE [Gracilibacillus halophilus]ENH97438.1 stage III sporulation protein AE [Gracilibacillus halophilus YIM-C55.5]